MYQDQVIYMEEKKQPSLFQNVRSYFSNLFSSETRQRSSERVQVSQSPSKKMQYRQKQKIVYDPVMLKLDFMRYMEAQLIYSPNPNEEVEQLIEALSAAAAAPGGNGDGKRIDPEDLKFIISILIRIGCLTASGPLLVAFESAGFVLTGYELSVKIDKMAKRVANGEAVLEPNRENFTEWLDITSNVLGLSSTLASNGLKEVLKKGKPQDCAEYLAKILEGGSLCSGTASIVVEQACSEYFEKQKDLSPQRRLLEYISTLLHFMEVMKFCNQLN